ncbi:MAG TPA: FAD-dependent oxidoreductase [Burkholderiaceae bacterium]|nr:FAD-dependent oxidoreductase [Burkholderiaceae bacterium]
MRRRGLLTAAACAPLLGCAPDAPPALTGGWVGANAERGHRWRDNTKSGAWPEPALQSRADVLVVGAGVAGLAAARALVAAGITDVRLFDLEDVPGGNSRGHAMGGMACPLGAHYLPVPGERAVEVIALLDELGLRRVENGQPVYDERHLCHSPQERMFIAGHWHEGLLPPLDALPVEQRAATQAQYRRFAAAVEQLSGGGNAFAIPTARSAWSPALDALDAVTFASWLDAQQLSAPALRWYLDYCCRDDYGAGAAQVSAWAGLHYFASRHGFHAPGDSGDYERDGVLTWPEGNAWLARRLAQPLGDRVQTGAIALQVSEERHEVRVDVWNDRARRVERWRAPQVVLATPLFIAARLLRTPVDALTRAVDAMRHAPWLVANLQLADALDDRPGAPPSWDNVIYETGPAGAMLGYVDAMHQSTRPYPGPTVLTAYWALGGDSAAQLQAQRARLLAEPWQAWAAAIVQDLARAHPDLPRKLQRIDLMRYGHAMSIPVPGLRSSAALHALAQAQRRVHFAHADLSAYSVFEEALYHGTRAASQVRAAFAGVPLRPAG